MLKLKSEKRPRDGGWGTFVLCRTADLRLCVQLDSQEGNQPESDWQVTGSCWSLVCDKPVR